jgi:hypothetical protein
MLFAKVRGLSWFKVLSKKVEGLKFIWDHLQQSVYHKILTRINKWRTVMKWNISLIANFKCLGGININDILK